jgi:hypothetical protein
MQTNQSLRSKEMRLGFCGPRPKFDGMRQLTILRIAAAMLIGMAALRCGAADDTSDAPAITKSFTVQPGGSVSVTADQGDIELLTGKQNTVEVVIERTAKDLSESQAASLFRKQKVKASLEGNNVYVETTVGKTSRAKLAELSVHIRVTVPRKFDAQLEAAGTIDATGLQGSVDAKTSGGDMSFTNIHGLLNAQSSGGNIRVTGCADKVQVRTSGGTIVIKDCSGSGIQADNLGGDITVDGCTGTLAVKTSGGNITLENFTGPQGTADTAGGTLTLDLAGAPLADSYYRTAGGNIVATLVGGAAVNLLATTDGGVITTAVPVSEKKGRLQEGRLEGQISGGGPKLVLKTGGGNIEILKK